MTSPNLWKQMKLRRRRKAPSNFFIEKPKERRNGYPYGVANNNGVNERNYLSVFLLYECCCVHFNTRLFVRDLFCA
jgi:hypothetical protein